MNKIKILLADDHAVVRADNISESDISFILH